MAGSSETDFNSDGDWLIWAGLVVVFGIFGLVTGIIALLEWID